MVHCISSSEPDSGELLPHHMTGSQDEWSRSSSGESSNIPKVDCIDCGIQSNQNLMHHHVVRKSPLTPNYVESTMSFINEMMKPQEAIVSSQKTGKRRHNLRNLPDSEMNGK